MTKINIFLKLLNALKEWDILNKHEVLKLGYFGLMSTCKFWTTLFGNYNMTENKLFYFSLKSYDPSPKTNIFHPQLRPPNDL